MLLQLTVHFLIQLCIYFYTYSNNMYIYDQTYMVILIHVRIINAFCFIPKMKKFLQMYGHSTLLRRKECIWKSKEESNIMQHINVLMLT